MESADGDMDLVRKALATGLLLNSARLAGTSVAGDRDAGTHDYELLRGSGKHITSLFFSAPRRKACLNRPEFAGRASFRNMHGIALPEF